jgi:hypothetical protein
MTKKRDLQAQIDRLRQERDDAREKLLECTESQEATFQRRSDAAKRGHAKRKARSE